MSARLVYRIVYDPLLDGSREYGCHAVILTDPGKVIGISKIPVPPRYSGDGYEAFVSEIQKYQDAVNHPMLNWADYNRWDMMLINGWDCAVWTDVMLQELIQERIEMY